METKRPNHRPNKELKTIKILDDEFYTINEVADILKVHHTTIRRAIKDDRLKAFKFGKKWLIKSKDIQKIGDM
jgi:excisionase family DNA binding protein